MNLVRMERNSEIYEVFVEKNLINNKKIKNVDSLLYEFSKIAQSECSFLYVKKEKYDPQIFQYLAEKDDKVVPLVRELIGDVVNRRAFFNYITSKSETSRNDFLDQYNTKFLNLQITDFSFLYLNSGDKTFLFSFFKKNETSKLLRCNQIEISDLTATIISNLAENEILTRELEKQKKKFEILTTENEKLTRNDKQYQILLENMGEGYAMVDLKLNFLFANNLAEKMFGVDSFGLMGVNLESFITEKEYKKVKVELNKLVKNNKTTFELETKSAKGVEKVFDVVANSYYDEGGKFVGAFMLLADITEKKWSERIQKLLFDISQAAHASRNLNQLYSSIHTYLKPLLNTKNFYIALYDIESDLISFPYFVDEKDQHAMPRSFGKGLTEIVMQEGKPMHLKKDQIQEMVRNDEIEVILSPANEWLGVPLFFGSIVKGALVVQSYDDQIKFSDRDMEILVFVSEQIAMVIDYKQADEKLKVKQQQLLEAQKIARIGLWEINLVKETMIFADSFFEIIGLSNENDRIDFDFDKLLEIIHPDDRMQVKKKYGNVQKQHSEEDAMHMSFRIFNKEDQVKYIDSVGQLRIGNDQQPLKFIITIQDVTEQKKTEDLIKAMEVTKRSAELKQQFLANMSHEIRTPLNAIIGFSKLLAAEAINAKTKGYIDTIISSGNTLLLLINDILDLSKIEAGKLELNQKPSNIRNLVSEVIQMFTFKTSEKNIALNHQFNPQLPYVLYIDQTRIRQVLLNLIGNSIKFTEKGFIDVAIDFEENSKHTQLINLLISVKDSGIGIPEEQQKSIFEAFRQISGQSYRKYGGTGLGLSITSKLVEIMGGHISLKSEVKKGTEFIVTIPNILIVSKTAGSADKMINIERKEIYQELKLCLFSNHKMDIQVFNSFYHNYKLENYIVVKNNKISTEKLKKMDFVFFRAESFSFEKHLAELKNADEKALPVFIQIQDEKMKWTQDFEDIKNLIDATLTVPFNEEEIKRTIINFSEYPYEDDSTESIEKNKQTIKEETETEVKIDKKTLQNAEKILEFYFKNLKTQHEEIKKTPKILRIKDFALKIQKYGAKKDLDYLHSIGKSLLKQAEMFQISKMNKSLEKFDKFIKSLQKQT